MQIRPFADWYYICGEVHKHNFRIGLEINGSSFHDIDSSNGY